MDRINVPGPNAKKIVARDSQYISNSYPRAYPFVMKYGKGTEVWDVDGIDSWILRLALQLPAQGTVHPEVVKSIKRQAREIFTHLSDFYHPIWVELFAERLDSISPFDGEGYFFYDQLRHRKC